MDDSKQSRRNVLLGGACGMGAALFSRIASAAPTGELSPGVKPIDHGKAGTPFIKLACCGYSYRQYMDKPGKSGEMSLFDLVDLCAELGLDGIEATSYYFLKTDDEFVYALKRKAFLAGIAITGMPIGDNFALPDGPAFDAELEKIRKWVDIAAKLGVPTMRIFAGKPNPQMSREQVFPQLVKGIKQACTYAGTKGIFLALEDHGFMTETANDVIRVVEAVDHPWFGVNLDTGNLADDPYGQIRKLAPYAIVSHIKTQVGGKADRQPADYRRIFQIFRDVKYRGYVALEYEGNDPRKEVPVEIRKMQAALRS